MRLLTEVLRWPGGRLVRATAPTPPPQAIAGHGFTVYWQEQQASLRRRAHFAALPSSAAALVFALASED